MLFGHQNDENPNQPVVGNDVQAPTAPTTNPLAVDPATGISLPVPPEALEHEDSTPSAALDQPISDPTVVTEAPTPAHSISTPDDILISTSDDELLTLKQQALQQLGPLVDHLEQSPEEKFRTTMMMIQSSDNQALVKSAYDAAQAIPDDKARAQALLDIINEINYFTQNGQKS